VNSKFITLLSESNWGYMDHNYMLYSKSLTK